MWVGQQKTRLVHIPVSISELMIGTVGRESMSIVINVSFVFADLFPCHTQMEMQLADLFLDGALFGNACGVGERVQVMFQVHLRFEVVAFDVVGGRGDQVQHIERQIFPAQSSDIITSISISIGIMMGMKEHVPEQELRDVSDSRFREMCEVGHHPASGSELNTTAAGYCIAMH